MYIRIDSKKRIIETHSENYDGLLFVDWSTKNSIMDDRGIYRYKLVDGEVQERTQEEMDADYTPPEEKPTTEERVDALETTTDDIILMIAELIGG